MTNHRDPIEDWLSRDVEVLPPRPGAFQQVRRRARRRKAVQAASVAAGVAVIIGAGISVPAITGNLFPGTGPARIGTPGPSASARPHAGLSGPALSTAGKGPAPAAGFRPTSVTFVGNNGGYLGAVLGQANCSGQPCTAMAGTANYGNSWTRIGAPPATLNSVSQVRFADQDNGWAFGPALWATHDGGVSWHQVRGVTGRLVDLATVDNQVLAVAATGCTGAGTADGPAAAYATSCTGFTLYAAVITSDHFLPVLSRPGGGLVAPGGLQLQSSTRAGYLIAGGRLYSGALDGSNWGAVTPESTPPGCLTDHASGSPALLAPSASELYAVCRTGQQLELYRSASSGRAWQASGRIAAAGVATSLTVSSAGTLALATTRGLSYEARGQTWAHVTGGSTDGMAFRYVGMTTGRLGVAVPSQPAHGELFITTDGGRTWRPKRISR